MALLHCDSSIHDCTIRRVAFHPAGHIRVLLLSRVESGVMSLSNDHDVNLRTTCFVFLIDLSACVKDLRKLLHKDFLVLTLRDT